VGIPPLGNVYADVGSPRSLSGSDWRSRTCDLTRCGKAMCSVLFSLLLMVNDAEWFDFGGFAVMEIRKPCAAPNQSVR
jgi:hypothetical protein